MIERGVSVWHSCKQMSWRDSYHLSNLILKIHFTLWKLLGSRGRTHSLNWINLCVVSLQDQLNAKICWSNMLPLMHQTFLYRSSCIIKSHFQVHCISLPSPPQKKNLLTTSDNTHPSMDSVKCRVPANVPVEVTCCDWNPTPPSSISISHIPSRYHFPSPLNPQVLLVNRDIYQG